MSTSSVCQGLQSCLEPGIAEARVLRLKLALPSSTINDSPFDYRPEPDPPQAARAMMDGLSFLQALASPSPDAAGAAAKVYVHPMVKRSASMLSAKSLEMCTESLGSETGSGDEMPIMLAMERRESRESSGVSQVPPKERASAARRVNRSASFPPPLASSVGGGFKVRPHREDGRLVLRAVAVPPLSSCFHAERADGRLRLRLLNDPRNGDVEGDESGEEDEEIGEEDGAESEINNGDYEQEEEEEEEEEDSDEEGGESERNGNVGVKRGKRKLERYSRCKEDGCGNNNRVLLNCNQPYLVAT